MRILLDDAPVDDVSLFIEPVDDEGVLLLIEPVLLLDPVSVDEPVEPVAPVEPVELVELDESVLEPVEPVELEPLGVLGDVEDESLFVVAPGERPTLGFWPLVLGVCVPGVWVVVLPGLFPVPVPLLEPPVPPACA